MPLFKYEFLKDPQCFETLMWLANGLKFDVIYCIDYEINNCTFYTKFLDYKSTIQNSEISSEAQSL